MILCRAMRVASICSSGAQAGCEYSYGRSQGGKLFYQANSMHETSRATLGGATAAAASKPLGHRRTLSRSSLSFLLPRS